MISEARSAPSDRDCVQGKGCTLGRRFAEQLGGCWRAVPHSCPSSAHLPEVQCVLAAPTVLTLGLHAVALHTCHPPACWEALTWATEDTSGATASP